MSAASWSISASRHSTTGAALARLRAEVVEADPAMVKEWKRR